MIGKPLTKTASLLEKSGCRRKIEISVKRRFYRDPNSGLLVPIDTNPQDAKFYSNYYFEVVKHDLHLAFAPKKSGLPFVRIGLPGEDAVWYLWFVGWDDYNPRRPIQPEVIDHGEGFVEWRLDADTRMRIEILGHLIRKLIILDRRPAWNRLRFRIGRAGGILIDGAAVGVPQRRLLAFRREAGFADDPLFWFSEPRCWDSGGENTLFGHPNYILTPITEALWEMTVEPDPEWLDNAQYPVYIDPTIVLQPGPDEGKDARVLVLRPDTNEGDIIHLNAYKNHGNIINGLICFDISFIPSGATINTASLYLTQWTVYEPYPHRVQISRLMAYWKELEVTWNERLTGVPWDTPGGDIDGIIYADEGGISYGDTELETASLVQLWVNGTYPNYGYYMRANPDGPDPLNGGVYWSSDYTDDPNGHPKLTIDYTEGGIFIPAKVGAIAGKRTLTPLASA